MLSSGTAAIQTSSNNAVTLLARSRVLGGSRNVVITNEGGVAGFVSFDGGSTKHRLAANQIVTTFRNLIAIESITAYRVTDGTDMTGLFASAW